MAVEEVVFDQLEKTELYTLYQRVNMEDVTNVFFDWRELDTMHKTCGHYSGSDNHLMLWVEIMIDCGDAPSQRLYINCDTLLAHLKSQFSDPKVKSVQVVFPSVDEQDLMHCINDRFISRKQLFMYSAAKGVFLRKAAPAEKTKIGKAPINLMQRKMANRLYNFLADRFSTVRITVTGSKTQMQNAVAVLKQLGVVLDKEWFDEAVAVVVKEHDLNDKLKKQLIETTTKWWNDASIE